MILASEYETRRYKILDKMDDNSILILFAGEPKKSSADETYPFEVNRNFYYMTGIKQEGSVLLLIKSFGEKKEYLFISPFDPKKEKWYGKKMSIEEATTISGVNNVLMSNALTPRVDGILNDSIRTHGNIKKVYLDLEEGQEVLVNVRPDDYAHSLEATYGVEIEDYYDSIIRLRMIKSEAEVDELRTAINTTKMGIQAVMAMARSGLFEYELANRFLQVVNDDSACQGLAFPTIMAGGKNATILHYPNPMSRLNPGDLLLMDLGGRSNLYNGDISRTIPVDGKFDDLQRKIYEIVLGCNKAVANYARPGVSLRELQGFAKEYLASECLSKGLIKDKKEIDEYYFHSVSHHIGLDTHDPADYSIPLEEGNVISDEPGLYFANLGIGVRIEDDLLITDRGAEVLSSGIIKEVKDIETFYASRPKK